MKHLMVLVALLLSVGTSLADFKPAGPSYNGARATVDLPPTMHIENRGGSDGFGLCVFTSVEIAARWQNATALYGFQDWMTKRPGGGWPEKLDDMISEFTSHKYKNYVQHTGGDVTFLEAALATGRAVSVTYAGRDDFYRGRVAHMVNLCFLDSARAAIIDNNRPGVWVWMTRAEFLSRWQDMSGGWAVVLLDGPPPPYHTTPAQYTPVQQSASGYTFAEWQDRPGKYGVFKNSVYVGTWDRVNQLWEGKPEDRPTFIPEQLIRRPLAPDPKGNYGVDEAKLTKSASYTKGGKNCSRLEAIEAMFEDDGDRPYLTVVGDEGLFLKVKAEVEALGLIGKVHLQRFDVGSWQQSQFRLPTGVSLRKPARAVRVAQEVGVVAPDAFGAGPLRNLLRLLFPNIPSEPSSPTPRVQVSVDFWTLMLGGFVLYLLFRKKQ